MKKVIKMIFKILGIILIAIIALVSILIGMLTYKAANYWKFAKPAGKIETKYTSMGPDEVSFSEYDTGENVWKKYEYWYPSAMKESNQKYPVVVIANGTGIKASGQAVIYKHLASWGFIVAANEDENSRTGESSAATLDYLLKLNEDKDSDCYQHVDEYRLELKDGETQGIAPRWWLNECFEKTSANNDAVMGRVIGKNHGDIPTAADGYLTAWFTYYLKGDEEAGKAFFGGNAEILSNPNWTDVTVSKEESL